MLVGLRVPHIDCVNQLVKTNFKLNKENLQLLYHHMIHDDCIIILIKRLSFELNKKHESHIHLSIEQLKPKLSIIRGFQE